MSVEQMPLGVEAGPLDLSSISTALAKAVRAEHEAKLHIQELTATIIEELQNHVGEVLPVYGYSSSVAMTDTSPENGRRQTFTVGMEKPGWLKPDFRRIQRIDDIQNTVWLSPPENPNFSHIIAPVNLRFTSEEEILGAQ